MPAQRQPFHSTASPTCACTTARLMSHYGLRCLKVETAGQSGGTTAGDSDLLGVIDAVEFRDALLRQRQNLLDSDATGTASPAAGGVADILTEIRDIQARIEAAQQNG